VSFYIRKAIRVGPVRFNLSKSGIGVSAGIKGLRVGSGPRGNYIHMGRGGLYFRKTLPSGRSRSPVDSSAQPLTPPARAPRDAEPLHEIASGSVLQMTDSSSAELLDEFNQKRKLVRIFPFVATAAVATVLVEQYNAQPGWLLLATILVGAALSVFTRIRDEVRKTVVVFYELDDTAEKAFGDLYAAFEILRGCSRAWHIAAEGRVRDVKYHAGANALVDREPIALTVGGIPFLKSNIAIPAVLVGRRLIVFMPDRVLVFDSDAVGAVAYSNLRIEVAASRFIEEKEVPPDARVVDQTWRYVNKSGGPDRRFKDNNQLPVVLYEQVHLGSDTGLNELVQFSRVGVGAELQAATAAMATSIGSQGLADGS
jgi:hypothetical protein